ncbi:MAG: response regulator [Planctomycetota bacterium]
MRWNRGVDPMANVLLVEDSPTQAMEMTLLLEAAEHTVVHASNGLAGLKHLTANSPDVVVTDLDMPEMNGLDLVRTLRAEFDHIPSILVTAQGSETLAAEALRCGAASYVPKSRMSDLLVDTVTDVLSVVQADASYAALIQTLQKNVFVFDMPCDFTLIKPLVGLLMQVSRGMDLFPSMDAVRFGIAIEHAVTNAMAHGILRLERAQLPSHHGLLAGESTEVMKERLANPAIQENCVHVEANATKQAFRVAVRDPGPGFDSTRVPLAGDLNEEELSLAATSLNDENSRGLQLMASFADQLMFNDAGNVVTLVKICQETS